MSSQAMYTRFERLWHWSQAGLIIFLLLTGFEVHGSYTLFGFGKAVALHRLAAWALIGLWILAWFWHLTTGEWKQYIPSTPERILAQTRYYAFGIFQGKPHPFHKDKQHKLNPLQSLTYLSLHVLIGPAIWISGLFYLFSAQWQHSATFAWLPLSVVAIVHTAAAFLTLAFLIAHVYLALTMDEKPFASLRAMITGNEPAD
ncbi:cytochrome b/b6 domain-containing protein [Granulosicoccaceae sp. 1_MG-2023]|nr:cytochrome b/b6 domain-containing protein [Granulosicoccaceae sp. 1_MG-2023]